MKPKRKKLPPMPPNMGLNWYDWSEPIVEIMDAIKRWKKLKRKPTQETK